MSSLSVINLPYSITTSGTTMTTTSGYWQVGDWQQPYIGDPIPEWGRYETPCTPYTITPFITPYPYQDNNEEIKKLLQEVLNKKTEDKLMMKVFKILVIDKKECKVFHEQTVIAKDKETAMLDLDLTPEIKEKVKKGLIEFIFDEKGQFTKVERKVEIKDLKDEE